MRINSKLSVLFWLKGKLSIEGKKSLYARLTIEGARVEVSLSEMVSVCYWDQERGCLTNDSPSSQVTNLNIANAKLKFKKYYDLLELQNEFVAPQDLKALFIGKKRGKKTLIEVADFVIEKMEKKVEKRLRAKTYLNKWKTTKAKIENYLVHEHGVRNIDLSKVEYSFAEDFFDYLTIEDSLCSNTASKYVKNLKHLCKTAFQRNWISKNPIETYRCSYIDPDRDILFESELSILYKKVFHSTRLQEIKDCFLFMCFTGFAYKDTKMLTRDFVVKFFDGEDWIVKNREKTMCSENVPLLPIAAEILEKYKDHPWCLIKNRLLPIKSNSKFNEYLKEIAEIAGINKTLSTHTARHTFATTVTLANGVPIETVSALLGHKSIRTTQIYAKIVAKKISVDMKKLKRQLILRMPISLTKKPNTHGNLAVV